MAQTTTLRRRMLDDMRLRNLSPATAQSYVKAVARFSLYFGRSPDLLGAEEVRQFQLHLVDQGLSRSYINQVSCGLRFFYAVTLGRADMVHRVISAREPKRLPVVLSAEEVARFLRAVPDLRNRTALTTAYAAGLRVSEVVGLTLSDIDSKRMLIRVRQGKGGKDRYVMLSPVLLQILRAYWRLVRPSHWLFPGRRERLSKATLQAACRRASAALDLGKPVTMHTLRHSFATHLLEAGTDIRIIQALLGHGHLSSTVLYTRVADSLIAGTPSPLDRLPPG